MMSAQIYLNLWIGAPFAVLRTMRLAEWLPLLVALTGASNLIERLSLKAVPVRTFSPGTEQMIAHGRRREAIRRRQTIFADPTPKPASSGESLTPIVFKGSGDFLVAGAESRQVYCFSPHDPEQMVDARDADALLKTGLFRVLS